MWIVTNREGQITEYAQCQLAVMMDIRDELKKLNAVFSCHNCQNIPYTLKSILRKLPTPKPRRKRVKKQK